ncbi:hypothetical protein B40_0276 [Lactococcus cremoris]|nr:hypothetical protein B40_0276 [Lactococcus cremoris]
MANTGPLAATTKKATIPMAAFLINFFICFPLFHLAGYYI